jgi:hypothetical protein
MTLGSRWQRRRLRALSNAYREDLDPGLGGVEDGDPFTSGRTDLLSAKASTVLPPPCLTALSFLQHAGQRHSTTGPSGPWRRERRHPNAVLMSVKLVFVSGAFAPQPLHVGRFVVTVWQALSVKGKYDHFPRPHKCRDVLHGGRGIALSFTRGIRPQQHQMKA